MAHVIEKVTLGLQNWQKTRRSFIPQKDRERICNHKLSKLNALTKGSPGNNKKKAF